MYFLEAAMMLTMQSTALHAIKTNPTVSHRQLMAVHLKVIC